MSAPLVCPHRRRTDFPCPYPDCHAAGQVGIGIVRIRSDGQRQRFVRSLTFTRGVYPTMVEHWSWVWDAVLEHDTDLARDLYSRDYWMQRQHMLALECDLRGVKP